MVFFTRCGEYRSFRHEEGRRRHVWYRPAHATSGKCRECEEFSGCKQPPLRTLQESLEESLDHLCDMCRKINFHDFLYSTYTREEYEKGLRIEDEDDKFFLGHTGDLLDRSGSCQLCSLIVDTAKRINHGREIPRWLDYPYGLGHCFLKKERFAYLYDVQHENREVSTVLASRATVIFSPNPFPKTEPNSVVTLQPYWKTEWKPWYLGSGRTIKDLVDIERLKSWLQQCENQHGKTCDSPSWLGELRQPDFLRVVDVKKKCVVSAPPNCRFLALSYVWGSPSRFAKITGESYDQLQRESALMKVDLPETIKDAMAFVEALGERYVWVDALCINQDDERDVANQTSSMNCIYASALVTIIAAAGQHANSPLPGIREGSRTVSQGQVEVGKGLCLMQTVVQLDSRKPEHSKWNSRGWTFQERLLSRRTFLFTEDQVYFNCEMGVWMEESILEPEKPRCRLRGRFDGNARWDPHSSKFSLKAFETYISQYSKREFSYPADILPGFLGVIRQMGNATGEIYHWGLPRTRFDQALNWQYYVNNYRRSEEFRLLSPDGIVHHNRYPSWSWLAWTGQISPNHYDEVLHWRTARGESTPDLDFYMLASDGGISEIYRVVGFNPDRKFKMLIYSGDIGELDRFYEGVFQGGSNLDLNSSMLASDGGISEVHRVVNASEKRTKTKEEDASNQEQCPAEHPFEDLRKQWRGETKIKGAIALENLKIDGLSQKISVLFLRDDSAAPPGSGNDNTVDKANTLVPLPYDTGLLVFWTSHAKIRSQHTDYDEVTVKIGSRKVRCKANLGKEVEDEREGSWDFIVISRSYEYLKSRETDILNLMIIRWIDLKNNVAMRLGLATMNERDWIQLDRDWKLVILA